MRKYYVIVKNWHKIRRRPMEVLLATHDLTTQFACAVLIMSFFRPHVHSICMRCIIDHQWSERLYTCQIITWGGSWYKIASARVPACACEEWVHAWSACKSSLHACTASMAQGGRVHSSGTSSTSLWSIHTRRSRQRLHMCHVASWTVRETLCSVPLVF